MKKNLSVSDSNIRLIFAVIIVLVYFTNVITGTLGLVLLILAGVLAITSLIGFCPLYALFGMSTRAKKNV